ncbi:isocitrate lyase/phosphoenolpyruvate mutase family protein [Actinoplanes sp. NPDC049118]|uniref:isocitrate lyase/PEP mutase family protein n=1 Tax=Actinoplanes sp. NPDC049118 TaxID=3155769 RepID=UPI0033D5BC4B
MTAAITTKAQTFRSLHRPGAPVVLPNAWDAASARVIEDAGAAAIATTSAGVAWSLGVPDGNHLSRDRHIEVIARIAAAVDVPVTADIESGCAADPAGVAATVREVLQAGAVGINLEDSSTDGGGPLRPVDDQTARIAAARQAADALGVPMFLNARIDTYLHRVGDDEARLAQTLARASAYLAAGADGIYVIGAAGPEVVSALVSGIVAPVNILTGPAGTSVGELAELGVARVSLGPYLAEAAYAVARRATRELLTAGNCPSLSDAFTFTELNGLVSGHQG